MTRKFSLTTAKRGNSKNWKHKRMTLEKIIDYFEDFKILDMTRKEYKNLNAVEKAEFKLKQPGFIGGEFEGSRRSIKDVLSRSLIALDIDETHGVDVPALAKKKFPFSYYIYETVSSTRKQRKYRIVFFLDKDIPPGEYQPMARKLAKYIGLELVDITCYRVNQMMYKPVFLKNAKPFGMMVYKKHDLVKTKLLRKMFDNIDNPLEWDLAEDEAPPAGFMNLSMDDPRTKPGAIGLFCEAYSVTEALDNFLSDHYEASNSNRYSYLHGSSRNGLVIYDDDTYCYSNHQSDPTNNGHVNNAYDMVRIVLFGDKDKDGHEYKNELKKPSAVAMQLLMAEDEKVRDVLSARKLEEVNADFGVYEDREVYDEVLNDGGSIELVGESIPLKQQRVTAEENKEFQDQLQYTKALTVKQSPQNLRTIIESDPRLVNRLRYDEFSDDMCFLGQAPWNRLPKIQRAWTDTDLTNLSYYISTNYDDIHFPDAELANYVDMVAKDNKFNPVESYFAQLPAWDGVERGEHLAELLGAEDTEANRLIMRKTLLAMMHRVHYPGCEAPNVTIFQGKQGVGKSVFWKLLCPEEKYFNDSAVAIGSKDGYEQLKGRLITELGELSDIKKSNNNAVKQFLASTSDSYRGSYARYKADHPRQGIIVGSTNDTQFLTDTTGNRRYKVIEVFGDSSKVTRETMTREYVAQVWAEAKEWFNAGEGCYFNKEQEAITEKIAETFVTETGYEPRFEVFCKMKVDIASWTAYSDEDKHRFIMERVDGVHPMPKHGKRIKSFTRDELVRWVFGDVHNSVKKYESDINKLVKDSPFEAKRKMNKDAYAHHVRRQGFQRRAKNG